MGGRRAELSHRSTVGQIRAPTTGINFMTAHGPLKVAAQSRIADKVD